jgi:hypothetical protein
VRSGDGLTEMALQRTLTKDDKAVEM